MTLWVICLSRNSNLIACDSNFFGQAIKGYWWMPWYQQAMKDANLSDNFGELAKSFDPEDSEWGNPVSVMADYLSLNP